MKETIEKLDKSFDEMKVLEGNGTKELKLKLIKSFTHSFAKKILEAEMKKIHQDIKLVNKRVRERNFGLLNLPYKDGYLSAIDNTLSTLSQTLKELE